MQAQAIDKRNGRKGFTRTRVGLVFSDSDAKSGIQIRLLPALNNPAGSAQLPVDIITGHLFGGLIHYHSLDRLFYC
jgi:hypothetical protein